MSMLSRAATTLGARGAALARPALRRKMAGGPDPNAPDTFARAVTHEGMTLMGPPAHIKGAAFVVGATMW